MDVCSIQWIDCSGTPTPDKNPAVGIAVSTIKYANGEVQVRRSPICEDHLHTLRDHRSHHSPRTGCRHHSVHVPAGNVVSSVWTFEPYQPEPAA